MPDGREVGARRRPEDARGAPADGAGRERRPTTPSATTSPSGSRRAPSSRSPTACGPARCRTSPTLEDLRADLIRVDPRVPAATAARRRRRLRPRDLRPGSRASARIGGGSLGGKARGLAFVNRLLDDADVRERFPGVEIAVPPSVVLATDVFDAFLAENDLARLRHRLRRRGRAAAAVPRGAAPGGRRRATSRRYLDGARATRWPSARRACSRTRQYQPFAGIYETYMLPNNRPGPARSGSRSCSTAIKRVYASTFSAHAKAYLRTTPYRLEEEKMAVILQKVVGGAHGPRFYPDFAGVARSHNFYPVAPHDGRRTAWRPSRSASARRWSAASRACGSVPATRGTSSQFSSVRDRCCSNSQREFYALDLGARQRGRGQPRRRRAWRGSASTRPRPTARCDRLGSTYSPENDAVYDGLSRAGVRLVSFAPVLKHELFPLAEHPRAPCSRSARRARARRSRSSSP